jgi:GntR family transcriptional regulator / MocR family aminotransferase
MDLHITLAAHKHVSGAMYLQIRDAILEGRLRLGSALPSSRELARRLQVSRNTVVAIYERLRAEGFVETRIGAGTYVSDRVRPRMPAGRLTSALRARAVWSDIPEGVDLSATAAEFDMRPGIPDASGFPFAAWRARISRQFRPRTVGAGMLIGAAGHAGLRAAIARHVGISRAVRATAAEVLVTSGSQQAVDLVARVLIEPGDIVAMEEPGYPLPRRLFRSHGASVVGIPVDDEGLIVDRIPAGTRVVYVTPSHQYPLGMAMSMRRRQALLAWADQADGAVIEDDYDSEFRYGGRPLESLQGLDGSGRVLYVGSFSKSLLPTLRLGFLVAPEPLHTALRKAKQLADWHTTLPAQAALAEFIDHGLLARHIRRMRRIYVERHRAVLEVLTRHFSGLLTPLPSGGGLHLTALLDDQEAPGDLALAENALALGVAVLPLSYHYSGDGARAGFLIGYGAVPTARIEEGLSRLRRCL